MRALLGLYLAASWASEPTEPTHVFVLTGEQVIQILDQTVDWYRTLGAQQQTSTHPSDLLIFYANQQTASQVVALAFDIARANAELLSSEASSTPEGGETAPAHTLDAQQRKLQAQRTAIQAEMDATKQQAARQPAGRKADLEARQSELKAELDMVNARINLLANMQQFVTESQAGTERVNALKAHIDAVAATIPAMATTTAPTAPAKPVAGSAAAAATSGGAAATGREGLWELGMQVLRLHSKRATIAAIDARTDALQQTFRRIREPLGARLSALSEQSEALATQADSAHGDALKAVRDRLDTLAWLFQQTSAILIPLSKEGVLLEQYRHNLKSWRDAVRLESDEALRQLGIRLSVLLGILAVVFAAGEIWRRLVVKYAPEPRHRYQLLLIQRLVLWTAVLIIIALAFVTQISTFATFAGLITAGLAVAMQSVLVSVVGYFLLIGKYGLRVGDKVQVGTVTGEVISLGLMRMHLLELNSQGPLGATGRTVAFANSIVFQAANGLFRQLPGVEFLWHEATLNLPEGSDYAALKARILAALNAIASKHQEALTRQAEQLGKSLGSATLGKPVPQVQLRFAASGVEATVRYPVPLGHEAETDERVSEELLRVLSEAAPRRE